MLPTTHNLLLKYVRALVIGDVEERRGRLREGGATCVIGNEDQSCKHLHMGDRVALVGWNKRSSSKSKQ